MFRLAPFFSALLLAVSALPAVAQGYDHPLTSSPSKDLNTWLLGVWEHKTESGKSYRATVTPKTGDRYWMTFQEAGRSRAQGKTSQFEAWISRVGNLSLLTLRSLDGEGTLLDGRGPVAAGRFAFVQYTLLDQENVRLRSPAIDASPETSGYRLRREVRQKSKNLTLFPDRGSDWTRISEVYWSRTDEPQPFQPLRYPLLTTPDED